MIALFLNPKTDLPGRCVRTWFLPPLLWIGLMTGSVRSQEVLQSSPQYEEEAARLREGKEQQYSFTRAQLRDVLRFLAEDAGINYMALPESEGDKDKLITFNMVASPFVALETVANTYGVALLLDRGVWHMRPLDDKQLIGRTYHLKYSSQEQVTTVSSSSGDSFGPISRDAFSSNLSGSGGGGGGGGFGGGMGGGMGGGGGGGQQGINLQGGPISHLASNAQELVSDIERILGIPTRGFDAFGSRKDVTVDDFGKDKMHTPQRIYSTAEEQGDDSKAEDNEPAVFWNSDTNNLFVVATRQQHQIVEQYLSSIDRPQPLIAVEVKFFETTSDPRKQFGVDWSETLDGGIPVNFEPVTPDGIDDGGVDGVWSAYMDWIDPSKSQYPRGAILSSRSASLKVQALLADRQTVSTSYPRVLTKNNREVVIRNVVNKPVLAASSSTTPGVGGTTTASVQYLPIGTTINVLPKVKSDGTVEMTVSLQLSNIIGSEIIGGNPYPVASSRLYTAPLKVESGYTVAIAGLDEAFNSKEGTGLPALSKIPILGYAFKNTQRSQAKKTLLMFITPTVLENDTPGVTESPVSTLPVRKEDPRVPAPQIYADGSLVGGVDKLPQAILWADKQERLLSRLIAEQRNKATTVKDIALLRRVVTALQNYIASVERAHPDMAPQLANHKDNLARVRARTWQLKCENWRSLPSDFLAR
jgi:type II secretory pathway component GspD/PulD (secretin)